MRSAIPVLLVVGATLALAGPLAAQTPPERKEVGMAPSPPPPPGEPFLVKMPRARRPAAALSRGDGFLRETRAVRLKDGEAILRVQGAERVLRAGDLLGSDVVKSVSEGRIVFLRPAEANSKAGDTLVIVEFDGQGQPQVLMLSERDTKPVPVGPPGPGK